MEELMEAKEAATILKVAPVTLYRWRRAGKGPEWAKIGRKVLYYLNDIENFVQSSKRIIRNDQTRNTNTPCP